VYPWGTDPPCTEAVVPLPSVHRLPTLTPAERLASPEVDFPPLRRAVPPRLAIESPSTAPRSAVPFNGPLSIMRRSHDDPPDPPVLPHDG
jgi:hypothetical protein